MNRAQQVAWQEAKEVERRLVAACRAGDMAAACAAADMLTAGPRAWAYDAVVAAATNGHVPILQWLFDNDDPVYWRPVNAKLRMRHDVHLLGPRVALQAAGAGHVHVLAWAEAVVGLQYKEYEDPNWSLYARLLASACAKGHEGCAKWVYAAFQQYFEGDAATLLNPIGREVLAAACRSGNLDLIRWVRATMDLTAPAPVGPCWVTCEIEAIEKKFVADLVPAAISSGNQEAVQWALQFLADRTGLAAAAAALPPTITTFAGSVEAVLNAACESSSVAMLDFVWSQIQWTARPHPYLHLSCVSQWQVPKMDDAVMAAVFRYLLPLDPGAAAGMVRTLVLCGTDNVDLLRTLYETTCEVSGHVECRTDEDEDEDGDGDEDGDSTDPPFSHVLALAQAAFHTGSVRIAKWLVAVFPAVAAAASRLAVRHFATPYADARSLEFKQWAWSFIDGSDTDSGTKKEVVAAAMRKGLWMGETVVVEWLWSLGLMTRDELAAVMPSPFHVKGAASPAITWLWDTVCSASDDHVVHFDAETVQSWVQEVCRDGDGVSLQHLCHALKTNCGVMPVLTDIALDFLGDKWLMAITCVRWASATGAATASISLCDHVLQSA